MVFFLNNSVCSVNVYKIYYYIDKLKNEPKTATSFLTLGNFNIKILIGLEMKNYKLKVLHFLELAS